MRLLIIGAKGGSNLGETFERAARELGLDEVLLDTAAASGQTRLVRTVFWRLGGRRWPRQRAFEAQLKSLVRSWKPNIVLSCGFVPLSGRSIRSVKESGARVGVFLSDDPWNPRMFARWFVASLREYDLVATPRRANMEQIRTVAPGAFVFLPFAYDPALHFPDPTAELPCHDALFIGGAERRRVEILSPLMCPQIDLGIYGDYWSRWKIVSPAVRGRASVAETRGLTARAKLSIVLPRFENRDGHTMRSFEAIACGGAVAAYDTPEHRELFGTDGSVALFQTPEELHGLVVAAKSDETLTARLRRGGKMLLRQRGFTYTDRLRSILASIVDAAASTPGASTATAVPLGEPEKLH